ncbi:mediator of RNA polymerase II transcription subunit 17 [Punica granatum]|uniref:Mediator of RNA polymerase II transcription subunit 17 n=2 Tax=Punica granatum TaxID=22663 RepID=A0A6P8D1P5_PUNGR|nr:mediator of RNA polymerase II transcription subunit 17 [Punica granatum]PKI79556.1 hypothetical protein CRG98_000031 [Punica granatum]
MDGKLEVSIDKLPVKRLDHIEENGAEKYPADVSYEEKRLSLIRRIDFAWAVEKDDKKKEKKSAKESSTPWQWQSMVENLQLAHQELSVIIDLINTVEANDAVTVASITRPKPLPHEHLSDLAVSAATKLQCFRHLGKYFKQSAKALDQQVAKEARFYGALIRLQQNWKVKRQRVAATAPSSEGFTIDLFDNSIYDPASIVRPSSISTVLVERDSAGKLAICVPPKSSRSLHFTFLGIQPNTIQGESCKLNPEPLRESEDGPAGDDESVKKTHSMLREVHRAIFDEQVFDLVNREAFNPSVGVNVTGIQENRLQLSLGQGTSVSISLELSSLDDQSSERLDRQNFETAALCSDLLNGVKPEEGKPDSLKKKIPNRACYEVYLQQIFHEHVFVRSKVRHDSGAVRASNQSAKDGPNLLSHFCMSLAHRIFSAKVLIELEKVVSGVPYLQLMSHPAWHSRTSSWTLSMKIPPSIPNSNRTSTPDVYPLKHSIPAFRTKVVVTDNSIKVEGEGAPNVVGLFKGASEDISSINRYDCDLADLAVIILQQVASQVIRWLHEEALKVGIKVTRDFLCISFELEQGETLSLVAHVDPDNPEGCISWWLVVDDGFSEERKLHSDFYDGGSEYRKFLGYLSLDVLYSTLMDLVTLCNGSAAH